MMGEEMSESEQTGLTVQRLLQSGFSEVDCWLAGDDRIHPPRNLPKQRGVYAFAVGERVMYVGLASRSIHQRLGFYARAGASQLTNVRLNGIIRDTISKGQSVRVLIAHPPDLEWMGLRMSGPEALEAALIEDFRPAWNMKGVQRAPAVADTTSDKPSNRRAWGSNSDAIVEFVRANPNCTELQIAKGVFGPDAVQPQVNSYCRQLVERGVLKRLLTRPITYVGVGLGSPSPD
jgi:hypothetical protein